MTAANQNENEPMICGHCRRPMVGYASAGDNWLCHPDEGMDCYRLVTVYKHPMPCVCSTDPEAFTWALSDQALLAREDLAESLKQMRRGEGRTL